MRSHKGSHKVHRKNAIKEWMFGTVVKMPLEMPTAHIHVLGFES